MSAPAIPAEKSPAEALNMSDGQTSLALWQDRDPNLHGLGIYEFAIEASKLNQVLQAAVLPKRRAPFLIIEVSTSTLKCIAQTKDASFDIWATAPLHQPAEIGPAPIRFEVDHEVMMNIGRNFKSRLAFTFERDSSELKWTEKGGSGDYRIEARCLPPAVPESGLRPLAVLVPQPVNTGVKFASTLIGRKSPPDFLLQGVRIEGGSIIGGYFHGVSRYRSPLLPESLALNVPKVHVANALALFSRLAGKVEVLQTDSRIYITGHNIEGSWERMDSWPGPLNRPFEALPLQTILVETLLLQIEAYIMAALFEEQLRVTVENYGAYARVVLSASSKIGLGVTKTLKGKLVYNGDIRPWDVTVSAKDLRDAACAITARHTLLGLLDQRLLIQSEGSEDECQTILLGRERQ